MNLSRLWAHLPGSQDVLADLLGRAADAASLSFRQKALLVSACASTMGDSYCSLAWGKRLAVDAEAGADVAAGVLRGDDDGLDPAEAALTGWARRVARDPNGSTAADVQALRDAGFDDRQIFGITTFVALRIAFSTVNDALGARPDRELGDAVPAAVRDAVTFGRPVAAGEG
jgi:alkylhydroperoxidase family enzyme